MQGQGFNLFVGGLAWATTDESLKEHFEKAGEVISAKVVKDRETGRSRGFGFVIMATQEGADEAIKMYDGQQVDGREVKVNPARDKEEGSKSQGGF